MLADMLGTHYLMGARETVLSRMAKLVSRALEAHNQCQLAHQMKAMTYLFRGRRDLFRAETERTLQINPNHSNTLASCGLFIAITGEWERGLALLDKAMRLNPHHPGWYHLASVLNFYLKGAYQKALQEATRVNLPGFFWDPLVRAASLGQLGRTEVARAALTAMQRALPETDIGLRELMYRLLFSNESVERLLDGLRKAGLEEPHAQGGGWPSAAPATSRLPFTLVTRFQPLAWLEKISRQSSRMLITCQPRSDAICKTFSAPRS
jgi:tetratricopeptide (TPR) repeat protein